MSQNNRRRRRLFLSSYFLSPIANVSSYLAICSLQPSPTYIFRNYTTDGLNTGDDSLNYEWHAVNGKRQLAGNLRDPSTKNLKKISHKEKAVPAWACICAPDFYCLSPSVNSCAISSKIGEPIKCIHMSSITMFARNIWFPLLVIYALLIVTLLATPNGKKSLEYVLHFCFRGRNRRLSEMISSEIEAYKKGNDFRRKELVLKTKIFESLTTSDMSNEDSLNKECNDLNSDINRDEDPVCSICIGEVEHGDRIGVLTCNHTFHVDCLKLWIKRSNVCPLCMSPDIATTRIRDGRDCSDTSSDL